jgi:hypothetical protein
MRTSSEAPTAAAIAEGPKGLGGWLILPIIHLFGTLGLTSYNLFGIVENWEGFVALLTGQVDPNYRTLVWVVLFSLVAGVAIVVFALYLLVLLFQKKRALPRLMVWFYFVLLGVTLIESGMVLQNPQQWTMADLSEARKSLGQVVFNAVIWIPYFLRSKRVRATFVN